MNCITSGHPLGITGGCDKYWRFGQSHGPGFERAYGKELQLTSVGQDETRITLASLAGNAANDFTSRQSLDRILKTLTTRVNYHFLRAEQAPRDDGIEAPSGSADCQLWIVPLHALNLERASGNDVI